MRESLEKLGHSKSAFVRTFYRLVKAGGAIFPATRRDRVKRFVLRAVGYRPRYCRRLSGWMLNTEPRSPRVTVSVTSYPGRIKTVHRILAAMLAQTLKPDAVVLWLGEDKFPRKEADLPRKLLKLRKHGLTIGWCRDLRSYTKLLPALKAHPEDIVVTGDDDTFYGPDWLKKLYDSYLKDPKSVHCHCVAQIMLGDDGAPRPYRDWRLTWKPCEPSFANLILGYGGVLYPPHVLAREVSDEAMFKELSPSADDLWFWAMAVKNLAPIRVVDGAEFPMCPDYCADQSGALANENIEGAGRNDCQFAAILARFPEVKARLLAASKGAGHE